MADAIYDKFREARMNGSANTDLIAGTVKAALVDTGVYTFDQAHEFLSDLTGRVGTDQTLTGKSVTNGAFDSDDPTWTGLSGNSVEAIVLYVDTGVAGTSRLIAYKDSDTGLPLTPSGGNVTFAVHASGWFKS